MYPNFEITYENISSTYILSILTVILTSVITFVIGWITKRKYCDDAKNDKIKIADDGVCHCHDNEEIKSTPEEDEALAQMTDDEINFQNIARHVNVAATAEKMIKSGLSKEQLSEEVTSQADQLAEIFTIMQQQEEKFGGMTMADMYQQMRLYR